MSKKTIEYAKNRSDLFNCTDYIKHNMLDL